MAPRLELSAQDWPSPMLLRRAPTGSDIALGVADDRERDVPFNVVRPGGPPLVDHQRPGPRVITATPSLDER
jgi:hypothetical protein